MRAIFGIFLFSAVLAHAQSTGLRDGDHVLTRAELTAALPGQTLTFYDNGRSEYFSDGRYAYTYDGGNTAYGAYRLAEDGQVCVAFENGFDRCDRFVRSGGRLVLITQKGERFPIRPE